MGSEDAEYPTAYMNRLANTRQTRWDTDASDGIKFIRDALADENSFGDVPALASYGRVFTEVRKIYLETMRGAKTDLDAVAKGIKTSAQQMTDNDDEAGAAFVALWQKWEQGPLDSIRNHEEAASTTGAQHAAAETDAAESTPVADVPTDEPGADASSEDTSDEGALPVQGPVAPAATLPTLPATSTIPSVFTTPLQPNGPQTP